MLIFKKALILVRPVAIRLSVALLLVVPTLLPASKVAAQSNGLGVTPKLTYTVRAGTQLSDTLYIDNLSTTQPLNLKLSVVDFKPQGETGAPKLLQSSDQPQTPWSLKPYLVLPDYVTIDPGKSKLVPFTIKIPASLGAGSYYSAVEYNALTSSAGQKVNVAASSATLMFVTVPGNTTEQLSMVQFGAEQNGKFKGIFSKSPSTFGYRLKNEGNIDESPAGSIVVKNIFGHVSAHIDDANPTNELVLLGQTRKFEVCNPKSTQPSDLGKPSNCQPLKLAPGIYTAEVELFYGQNGSSNHQIGAKSTFWYLPVWFVVVFILVLLLIAYVIYYIYRRITAPRHHHKHQR